MYTYITRLTDRGIITTDTVLIYYNNFQIIADDDFVRC